MNRLPTAASTVASPVLCDLVLHVASDLAQHNTTPNHYDSHARLLR
jgi:hypothetical protein